MRIPAAAAFTASFVVGGAAMTQNAPAAHAQTASPIQALVRSGFAHPNASPPPGPTTFTPADPATNLFTVQMLAKISGNPQKQAMQVYAGQINQMVEKAYTGYGYEKNDLGVAFGGFLETRWQISNGSFKTAEDNPQDKARTQAAVRQMQNALLAAPAYKTMPNRNKQLLYELCTFGMGHLATQWQQAGGSETKKATAQQAARQQLQSVFGIDASSLKHQADGTFVSANAASGAAVASGKPGGKSATASEKHNAPPVAAASTGPLPPASAHRARIFVKCTFQPTETSFDQLILFPGGAAFTDVPSKPVSRFDEATLRASLKPYDVGTWKQSGTTLVLTFPNQTRDKVTTLRKVPKGWYDGTGKIESDSSYDTYFPAAPLTSAQIAGPWKTESLVTMGMAGGAAPMVAHGSSGKRVFRADGTFAGGSESFTSATTANMGDGFKSDSFKSGGDVGVYGTKNKKGVGRWRLDGPLITMESDGKRSVALAYVLPHPNKTGPPEILIDGDWWRRPDKK